MNNTNLPALPTPGTKGPEVCAIIRLYLAVWDDLSYTQQDLVAAHLKRCPDCERERQLFQRVTHLVASMEGSQPSPHIDQAVRAAITSRGKRQTAPSRLPLRRPAPIRSRIGGIAAAAAIIVFALISAVSFWPRSQSAFALPADLSWKPYVLYHTQTMHNTSGQSYEIISYHDMSDQNMKVETVMDNQLHVVAVKDAQKTLGLDMMHHVAQWDAKDWIVNESRFDLEQLKHDLQTGNAVYVGKDHFRGQEVYQIRYHDGSVLLLDMHYMPVNVLSPDQHGQPHDTMQPTYTTLRWLQPSEVPDSTWNMQVPPDYHMGQLPPRPE